MLKDQNLESSESKTKQPVLVDKRIAQKSHSLKFDEIDVLFPFEPYKEQEKMVETVIKTFKEKTISAIESPTGTGKTLSLLSSSLAFLKSKLDSEPEFDGRIIYTTRTNMQIDNILKELKLSPYRPKWRVLASRDILCVNPDIQQFRGNARNLKCAAVRSKQLCHFFSKARFPMHDKGEVLDIEELKSVSESKRTCPYYNSKAYSSDGEMIIMTYNYLLDDNIRESSGIDISKSYIIFDEGHNISSSLEESSSLTITFNQFNRFIQDFKDYRKKINKVKIGEEGAPKSNNSDKMHIGIAIDFLNRVKKAISDLKIGKFNSYEGEAKRLSTEEFIDLMFGPSNQTTFDGNTELTPLTSSDHVDVVEAMIKDMKKEQIDTQLNDYLALLRLTTILAVNYKLNKKSNLLEKNLMLNYYVLVFREKPDSPLSLGILNMNPGIRFNKLFKDTAKGLVIASGTLSPISLLETELGVKFGHILQNDHVVEERQKNFDIISKYGNLSLNLSYASRRNNAIKTAIGQVALDLVSKSPGNALFYFGSSAYMKMIFEYWADNGFLKQMEEHKKIFKETKDKEKNKIMLEKFLQNGRDGVPSLLFTVMRSAASEGFNFKGDCARLAVVFGVPFASFGSLRITLKKDFFNKTSTSKGGGWTKWYNANAMSAVNQSLGRVIRDVFDYGSMICVDQRFLALDNNEYFCNWIKSEEQKQPAFRVTYDPVKKNRVFFTNLKDNPVKKIREPKKPKAEKEFEKLKRLNPENYYFKQEIMPGKDIIYEFKPAERLLRLKSCSICSVKVQSRFASWCPCFLCENCTTSNMAKKECASCKRIVPEKTEEFLF